MKKTDEEIEKMLLDELEETIVMGWADGSGKSLLLELIRERRAIKPSHPTPSQPTGETLIPFPPENYPCRDGKEIKTWMDGYESSVNDLKEIPPPTQSADTEKMTGEPFDVAQQIIKKNLTTYTKNYPKVNWLPFERIEQPVIDFVLHCMLDFRDYSITKSGLNKEEVIKWIERKRKSHDNSRDAVHEAVNNLLSSLEDLLEPISLPSPPPAQREEGEAVKKLIKEKTYKDECKLGRDCHCDASESTWCKHNGYPSSTVTTKP